MLWVWRTRSYSLLGLKTRRKKDKKKRERGEWGGDHVPHSDLHLAAYITGVSYVTNQVTDSLTVSYLSVRPCRRYNADVDVPAID